MQGGGKTKTWLTFQPFSSEPRTTVRLNSCEMAFKRTLLAVYASQTKIFSLPAIKPYVNTKNLLLHPSPLLGASANELTLVAEMVLGSSPCERSIDSIFADELAGHRMMMTQKEYNAALDNGLLNNAYLLACLLSCEPDWKKSKVEAGFLLEGLHAVKAQVAADKQKLSVCFPGEHNQSDQQLEDIEREYDQISTDSTRCYKGIKQTSAGSLTSLMCLQTNGGLLAWELDKRQGNQSTLWDWFKGSVARFREAKMAVPLTFNKDSKLTANSKSRLYLFTHLVFVCSRYGIKENHLACKDEDLKSVPTTWLALFSSYTQVLCNQDAYCELVAASMQLGWGNTTPVAQKLLKELMDGERWKAGSNATMYEKLHRVLCSAMFLSHQQPTTCMYACVCVCVCVRV